MLTNKTPSGLVRGFGGPQVYFALERLMQRIAVTLGLDPLDVIRRNFGRSRFPIAARPARCSIPATTTRAVEQAVSEGGLTSCTAARARRARRGRLYGIGFAAIVEPSISNMGYITTVLTPEERAARPARKAARRRRRQWRSIRSAGSRSMIDSLPQGQGHRTVAAQVVADVFGLPASAVRVEAELDTGQDAWSIAAGNYSSRFAGATAGAAYLAATRLRDKLARIAAAQLNVRPEEVRFAEAAVSSPPTTRKTR